MKGRGGRLGRGGEGWRRWEREGGRDERARVEGREGEVFQEGEMLLGMDSTRAGGVY